ncbi:MAG: hypothetical protein OXE76_07695, partial [Alphaproteobacteria bacterium]|nr:hypothetical protein [Alphaproteobacteria bacterium]
FDRPGRWDRSKTQVVQDQVTGRGAEIITIAREACFASPHDFAAYEARSQCAPSSVSVLQLPSSASEHSQPKTQEPMWGSRTAKDRNRQSSTGISRIQFDDLVHVSPSRCETTGSGTPFSVA